MWRRLLAVSDQARAVAAHLALEIGRILREGLMLAAPPVVIAATGGCVRLRDQAALAVDFATWVAIASISAGDRQS